MTPKPLAELTLWPRDHGSALWWLAAVYRKPRHVEEVGDEADRVEAVRVVAMLYLHALPYMALMGVLGGWAVALAIGQPFNWFAIVFGIGFGIVVGIGLGIVVGIGGGIGLGIAGGIAGGIGGAIVVGIVGGIVGGICGGIALGKARTIGGGIGGGIVGGIGGGIGLGIGLGISEGFASGTLFTAVFTIPYFTLLLRLYYHPVHLIFLLPRLHGTWYRFHPAAWDDVCPLPFWGLNRLLVDYHRHEPEKAEVEIQRWIESPLRPGQRMQALRARTILIAQEATKATGLTLLPSIVSRLPTGEKGFLAQTPTIIRAVEKIRELQVRFDTTARATFRRAAARDLFTEIAAFRGQVSGFREPLASEFGTAANAWLNMAMRALEQAEEQVRREPVRQVFRAGDPVEGATKAEAFIPRLKVLGRLEQQVMLSTGCPGIILYGRRRRGKSTVLRNLMGGFLPPAIHSAVVSMQNPEAFTTTATFCGQVVKAIHDQVRLGVLSLPDDPNPKPTPLWIGPPEAQTLPELFKVIGRWNWLLGELESRLLLALDEYENIDSKIGEGVFTPDLLATIRESIQTHRNITWLFAGSHGIDELKHAPWTSYLVSARTVPVPNFTPEETRQLLTEPLKYSPLWEQDSPERPRFASEFWGPDGIERIQDETNGWPHLVQLVAETCVDLVNEHETGQVTPEIMEDALDWAIERGDTVLSELLRGESQLPGEWDYVSAFRTTTAQPPPQDLDISRSLRRREIIREHGDTWKLAVPLMERWLKKRG